MNLIQEIESLTKAIQKLNAEKETFYGPYDSILKRGYKKRNRFKNQLFRKRHQEEVRLAKKIQLSPEQLALLRGNFKPTEFDVRSYILELPNLSEKYVRILSTYEKKLSKLEKKAAKYYAAAKEKAWVKLSK